MDELNMLFSSFLLGMPFVLPVELIFRPTHPFPPLHVDSDVDAAFFASDF